MTNAKVADELAEIGPGEGEAKDGDKVSKTGGVTHTQNVILSLYKAFSTTLANLFPIAFRSTPSMYQPGSWSNHCSKFGATSQ